MCHRAEICVLSPRSGPRNPQGETPAPTCPGATAASYVDAIGTGRRLTTSQRRLVYITAPLGHRPQPLAGRPLGSVRPLTVRKGFTVRVSFKALETPRDARFLFSSTPVGPHIGFSWLQRARIGATPTPLAWGEIQPRNAGRSRKAHLTRGGFVSGFGRTLPRCRFRRRSGESHRSAATYGLARSQGGRRPT